MDIVVFVTFVVDVAFVVVVVLLSLLFCMYWMSVSSNRFFFLISPKERSNGREIVNVWLGSLSIYIFFRFLSHTQTFFFLMSSSESESWSRLIQRVVRTKNQEKNNNVTYSQKGLKKIVRKLEAINAQFEGVDSEFREKAAILDFDIVRYPPCNNTLCVLRLFITIKPDVTQGKNLNVVGGLRTNWIVGKPGVR